MFTLAGCLTCYPHAHANPQRGMAMDVLNMENDARAAKKIISNKLHAVADSIER